MENRKNLFVLLYDSSDGPLSILHALTVGRDSSEKGREKEPFVRNSQSHFTLFNVHTKCSNGVSHGHVQ